MPLSLAESLGSASASTWCRFPNPLPSRAPGRGWNPEPFEQRQGLSRRPCLWEAVATAWRALSLLFEKLVGVFIGGSFSFFVYFLFSTAQGL